MIRCGLLITTLTFLTIPSQAAVIIYSQNFESGPSGQFSGGTLLNTSGIPSGIGDGTWALYTNSGGDPRGTTSNPISFQLTGLGAFQAASLELTFIAIDSWDGLTMGDFSNDYFNIQVNSDLLFQAAFQNYGGVPHYTGDWTYPYGINMPANSTITPLSSLANYVGSYFDDMVYNIRLDGMHADAQGHLNVFFYASGAGWQGDVDESWAVDNIRVFSDAGFAVTENPEPATWLLFGTGFGGLLALRRKRAKSA